MQIAFYAPLKPPDHPVASGDRKMARSFMALLTNFGHKVDLACRLRTFDRTGSLTRQRRLQKLSAACSDRLLRFYEREPQKTPNLWFTYHAYHKAPDWIGPIISRTLQIPYIVAEASIAGKQADGPWAEGHKTTCEGLAEAAHILAMTRGDEAGIKHHLPSVEVSLFPPFLNCRRFPQNSDRKKLSEEFGLNDDAVWLISIAMMRNDVKRQSFELLAETLAFLGTNNWQLLIAGDGVARAEIEPLFSEYKEKVFFLGRCDADQIAQLLASIDIMVWPALREAYGMALLEAQAAGVPVVACREGGVSDVVIDGKTGLLVDDRSPELLGTAVNTLIANSGLRRTLGRNAFLRTRAVHDENIAVCRLKKILDRVVP